MRPASITSIGSTSTLAPALAGALGATASASSVATYTDHAGGWPSCMIGPTPGDLLAPQGEHPVPAGLLDRAGGLQLPAEQAAVEGCRGVGVRAREVDPGRHAGLVGGAFAHGCDARSLRRKGTTVCKNLLRVGRRGQGVEVALGGRRVDEHRAPAGDLRARDEAPGAAQHVAVGQVGLQGVERQVDRAAVPRAQLQVVALRVARQRVDGVDVDRELGREVPLGRVGGLLAEGLRERARSASPRRRPSRRWARACPPARG